jgi:hypothetical protein
MVDEMMLHREAWQYSIISEANKETRKSCSCIYLHDYRAALLIASRAKRVESLGRLQFLIGALGSYCRLTARKTNALVGGCWQLKQASSIPQNFMESLFEF